MGLDYTGCCVNFRDVGVWVNTIAERPLLPEGRLLRGGTLDFVRTADEIGSPGTIANLRRVPDALLFGADYRHIPASSAHRPYDTAQPAVRQWLVEVVQTFQDEALRYPVLFHCTSGKDRTGVAVAALLTILGVPRPVIVEEYLLSEGDVDARWIRQALDGLGDTSAYFDRVDCAVVCRTVRGGHRS